MSNFGLPPSRSSNDSGASATKNESSLPPPSGDQRIELARGISIASSADLSAELGESGGSVSASSSSLSPVWCHCVPCWVERRDELERGWGVGGRARLRGLGASLMGTVKDSNASEKGDGECEHCVL